MSWKFFLYDWGGLNAALFQLINQDTPSVLVPVAWVFSNLLGTYWTAPLVILGLWAWSRSTREPCHSQVIRSQLVRFTVAFALALAATSILKLLFDYPRPAAVYGHLVHTIGAAEEHYSLPSGHSTYAALVAGALWPLVGTRRRLALILYLVLVGWSRIAVGMHFPADVLAGWTIGLGSFVLVTSMGATLTRPPCTKVQTKVERVWSLPKIPSWPNEAYFGPT